MTWRLFRGDNIFLSWEVKLLPQSADIPVHEFVSMLGLASRDAPDRPCMFLHYHIDIIENTSL